MRWRYPKRKADIRLKRFGQMGILLNLRTGDFFELDATALAIWQRLDGRSDLRTIAQDLERTFKAPAATIARDVRQFVTVLRRRGLIDAAG